MSYYNQKQVNDITKSIKFSQNSIDSINKKIDEMNLNKCWNKITFSSFIKDAVYYYIRYLEEQKK